VLLQPVMLHLQLLMLPHQLLVRRLAFAAIQTVTARRHIRPFVIMPNSVQRFHMTGVADRHDTSGVVHDPSSACWSSLLTMIGSSSQDTDGHSNGGCSEFCVLKLKNAEG